MDGFADSKNFIDSGFPWVDCIVSGEADALFPELCRVLGLAGSGTGCNVDSLDTRPYAVQRNWTVEGLEADIYRMCDSAQKPSTLNSALGKDFSTDQINSAIDNLLLSKVLLSMNDKLLALGVNQRA